MENTYHGAMGTIEHCQTKWEIEFREAAAMTRAQCADHRVVVDGAKTNDAIAIPVRHEDFPRQRHHGDTIGIMQRAGLSRQLSHPRTIQSPQHCHTTVHASIRHEEEICVGGERKGIWINDLTGFITLQADGDLPLALHLGRL